MVLSNLHLIPSQLVLPLAGYLVGQERFSFPLVLIASTAGSMASALILYAPGRWIGEEPVRRFVERFGRFILMKESDLDRASGWFDRHGGKAVLISRLVPGVGNLISVPAGIEQMPVWQFVAYTTLGNGLWNAGLIGLGWALGAQWTLVKQYAPIIEYAILAAIAGVILWSLWRRCKAYK
jgi:membrane protein DedA with SNARE-associated domain